jgi:hypothetical protein
VPAIPAQLKTKYGTSFIEKNLRRMLRYAENFSAKQMVMAFSKIKLVTLYFFSLAAAFLLSISKITAVICIGFVMKAIQPG